MKFVITGDLHGASPNFYFKNFDAIISPGDFCSTEARKYMFKDKEWYDIIGRDESKKIIKESISKGRKVLEELNAVNKPVYVVPGNWDYASPEDEEWDFLKHDFYDDMIKDLNNVIDTHYKLVNAGQYQIIGYGKSSSPEYPQENLEEYTKKELKNKRKSYEKKFKKLNELFKKSTKPVIFLCHNVPYNTQVDKINNKDSPKHGLHWGSVIARDLIEENQPLICIAGHMHENFGKCKIGKTSIINSGFGPEVNTFLELEGSEIKKIEMRG